MAWEMTEGSGSLFKNDKEGNEKRPDYRGEMLVGGQVYYIAAWIREGKKGKFMSLTVKPKADKAPDVLPKVQGSIADMDNDIPFN